MKRTLLLCLLLIGCLFANAQIYDSAIHYKMAQSFFVAMDTLIARATASIADTGGESAASL